MSQGEVWRAIVQKVTIGLCRTGASGSALTPLCCTGKRVFGTPAYWFSVVIDNIAVGVPHDEILRSYPVLTEADIEAALAYSAELAREGTADLPLETKA